MPFIISVAAVRSAMPSHGLDHAHGIRAQAIGQCQRVAARAEIDVDEVDGDEAVAHACLAGARRAGLGAFEPEHLGAAGGVKTDGLCHGVSLS
jgi:hypothetical protein